MRQKREKDVFISTLKKEIKVREKLQKFYKETFYLAVTQFNGKVYNKKFETALNNDLQAVSPLFSVSCTQRMPDGYSNYKNVWYIEVELKGRTDPYNYEDKQVLHTKVMLKFDDNYNLRIDASITDEYNSKVWYENFVKETEARKDAIKNYNKYLKIAQKVTDAINTYKELPFRFRNNIEFTNLYYLK